MLCSTVMCYREPTLSLLSRGVGALSLSGSETDPWRFTRACGQRARKKTVRPRAVAHRPSTSLHPAGCPNNAAEAMGERSRR
ncbi:hypothetical protein NDU88_000015 [Pleurodeles waltl]|uniref:Uncharacterized protein n=1 Tax=Pleurodeles waltl TaxID=8319 RepID=A0AAV7TFX1_PLEWA|nr:hypothetical protein NDU88_000015 [Pleurodeles waltl]